MSNVKRRFPVGLTITACGIFLLTLITPIGAAQAELFILQGERGPEGPAGPRGDPLLDCSIGPCVLDGDLEVSGSITGEAGFFDTLEVDELTVARSVWLPECPRGYERDDSREDIILCTDGRDEMVKVGDFWVDRYEASVWSDAACSATQYGGAREDYPATFPDSGQVRARADRLFACSVIGVTPSRELTWFQAQAACAASGKSLITNAEWQAAVAGTVDPGASAVDVGPCRTLAGSPRSTGRAGGNPSGDDSCVSLWGAEDMIGNLWEWTADWWQAGGEWVGPPAFTDGAGAYRWPDGFSSDGQDGTWNLDGRVHRGDGYRDGLPAAAFRGGSWNYGTQAGAFALSVDNAPSLSFNYIGFRCAVH